MSADSLFERFTHEVNLAVAREMARRHAIIERACEQSVQGGKHGMKVVYEGPPPYHQLVSAAPDPSVPFGMIHEYPWGDNT